MARTVKRYAARRIEFLDAAQRLFFSKGYEQTSVQDIIASVGVAKGTFYHYFQAKAEILDAIVKRMYEQTLISLEPVIADTSLNAVQKFESFFSQINQWKVENKALMLETARILYQDKNILLREKAQEEAIRSTAPILTTIIEQGVAEGVFDVEHYYETAELILTMIGALSQAVVKELLTGKRDEQVKERMQRHIIVCHRSVERALGMIDGSLRFFDINDLKAWL